jgi:hypothetical protein
MISQTQFDTTAAQSETTTGTTTGDARPMAVTAARTGVFA